MTRWIPFALAAIVLSLVAAPQAAAAPGVKYGLTDDAWLLHGPGTVDARVARLDTLGVRVVRYTLRWDQIARTRPTTPADPSDAAYDWSSVDTVLDSLRGHGIDVV